MSSGALPDLASAACASPRSKVSRVFQFISERPTPMAQRSGLPACASLSEPGSRMRISSKVDKPVLSRMPCPPMFVPEPGMSRTLVTPPATARWSSGLRGVMLALPRSSGLVR